MSPEWAVNETRRLEAVFPLLPDPPTICPLWKDLVEHYKIIGKQVHDARLVAVMLAHGVTNLLTFNVTHFTRFSEITVLDPRDIPQPPASGEYIVGKE